MDTLPVLLGLAVMAVLSSPLTARIYGGAVAILILLMVGISQLFKRGGKRVTEWVGAGKQAFVIAVFPWLFAADRAAYDHGWMRSGGILWDPRWRSGITHVDRDPVLVICIGLVTAITAIFLSGVVDRVLVLPLMRGEGKGPPATAMPCQSSTHRRWKHVSRVWLAHRLLSTLGFVLGMTVAVTLSVATWVVGDIDETTAAAIAATATLLAGFYLTRARAVMAYIQNPGLWVGDTVEIVDEGTNSTRRYYVQDVALEGAKLLEITDDDRTPRRDDGVWPSHDRMLDLPDVHRVVRGRRRFVPCEDCPSLCKRVNPECKFKEEEPSESSPVMSAATTRGVNAVLSLIFLTAAFRPRRGGWRG